MKPVKSNKDNTCQFLYATAVLLSVTRLPIESFWMRVVGSGSGETFGQLATNTCLVIQIPALYRISQNYWQSREWELAEKFSLAFLSFVLISALWSTDVSISIGDSVLLISGSLSVIYLAVALSKDKFLWAVLLAFQIPITISFWAVLRGWGIEIHPIENFSTGIWQGIYTNRNFLAATCAFGTIFAFVILAYKKFALSITQKFVIALCILLNTIMLIQTKSEVGKAVVLIFLITLGLVHLSRTHLIRVLRNHKFGAHFVSVILIFVLSISNYFLYQQANTISASLERTPGLSGRNVIWRAGISRVFDHPFFGRGWMASWWNLTFRQNLPTNMSEIYWSHSAYLDITLSLGLLGFVLFIAWVFVTLKYLLGKLKTTLSSEFIALFFTILVFLMFESLSRSFHYLIAICVSLPVLIRASND